MARVHLTLKRMWEINRYSVLAFGILLADQVFDLLIEMMLPLGASLTLIASWLGITRFNGPSGGALDTNGSYLLLAIVLVPLFVWFKTTPNLDPFYCVGVSLILGGLLGNLADGLRVGYPVDYLVAGRPINPADVALLLGVGVVIYRLKRKLQFGGNDGRAQND